MSAFILISLLIAAFILNGWLAVNYFFEAANRKFWRGWKGWAAVAAFSALFLLMFHFSASVPLRGGYDNEHCFGMLSFSALKVSHWPIIIKTKEVSPVIGFGLTDLMGGTSLAGVTVVNRLLWPVCALLAGAALFEMGAGFAGVFVGTGLLSLNFLSILNSHTFSSTNWNMFFVLCAVLSGARLAAGKNALPDLAWFVSSTLLVLAGRFEFFPVLLLPLLPALVRTEWKKEWKRVGAALLAWVICCAAWVLTLRRTAPDNGRIELRDIYGNTAYHLGLNNFSVFTGVNDYFWAKTWLAVVIAAVLLGIWLVWKRDRRFIVPLWLSAWALFFASIFMPLDKYPLHFMRHDLYFFLPFSLLAGVLVGYIADLRGLSNRLVVPLIVIILIIYSDVNLKTALSFNSSLRTNDIEWQFLVTARKNWPANCRATTTDHYRAYLLMHYFPYAYSDATLEGKCLLFYRTPRSDIFSKAKRKPMPDPHVPSSVFINYSSPWLHQNFRHRFYTIWTNAGPEGFDAEETEPIPLTLGFYPAKFSVADVDRRGAGR